jgi:hypothetical protein
LKISYARRAIAVSLTDAVEDFDALDLERGFTACAALAVFGRRRVAELEVVRFMTLIVATSRPAVPVPATLV